MATSTVAVGSWLHPWWGLAAPGKKKGPKCESLVGSWKYPQPLAAGASWRLLAAPGAPGGTSSQLDFHKKTKMQKNAKFVQRHRNFFENFTPQNFTKKSAKNHKNPQKLLKM